MTEVSVFTSGSVVVHDDINIVLYCTGQLLQRRSMSNNEKSCEQVSCLTRIMLWVFFLRGLLCDWPVFKFLWGSIFGCFLGSWSCTFATLMSTEHLAGPSNKWIASHCMTMNHLSYILIYEKYSNSVKYRNDQRKYIMWLISSYWVLTVAMVWSWWQC